MTVHDPSLQSKLAFSWTVFAISLQRNRDVPERMMKVTKMTILIVPGCWMPINDPRSKMNKAPAIPIIAKLIKDDLAMRVLKRL